MLEVHCYNDCYENEDYCKRNELSGLGIDLKGRKTERTAGDLHVVDDILDYFAAGKCDNRKVITAEPQCGKTDNKTDDRGNDTAEKHRYRQSDSHRKHICKSNRYKTSGKQPSRHESGMTERKLAEQTHDKVE